MEKLRMGICRDRPQLYNETKVKNIDMQTKYFKRTFPKTCQLLANVFA